MPGPARPGIDTWFRAMSVRDQNSVYTSVDRFLSERPLPVGEETSCPYLPDLAARSEGFTIDDLPGELYQALLDRNFRRSGRVVYRPVCSTCRACRQIRVPVAAFRMSRSQRRVWRRNGDVRVTVSDKPRPTEEKWRLFASYLRARHDGTMSDTYESFVDFLYASPIELLEFLYWVDDRLIGVSVTDRCPDALSSVYMYFDAGESARGLGTFSILWEIEYCRRNALTYYYLGFYVAGSNSMAYKARFAPGEILDESHTWREVSRRETSRADGV